MPAPYSPSADAMEFRIVFEQPINVPVVGETAQMQAALIAEESTEFLQAFDLVRLSDDNSHKAECLKELADLLYVGHQFAAAIGWDLDEALARVHSSNMSKVHPDGTIKRRADGKILKPETYEAPNLDDLI